VFSGSTESTIMRSVSPPDSAPPFMTSHGDRCSSRDHLAWRHDLEGFLQRESTNRQGTEHESTTKSKDGDKSSMYSRFYEIQQIDNKSKNSGILA